jgi:hypothetical protein
MRAWVHGCVAGVCVACTAVAWAAPKPNAAAAYQRAAQLEQSGNYEVALVEIENGLASAPRDLALLGLKGTVLLKLHDYPGALATYQLYLDAGARGANRRDAEKIVDSLRDVQSTFLDIALASGPATIYLDSKTRGVFCTATPSCHRAILPGEYKVIAEREGHQPWTGRVTVAKSATTKLSIALVETRSPVAIRVTPPDARITIDDAPYDPSAALAAGHHRVVVARAGYVEARLDAECHEGKPVALDVALAPLVPIRVEPAGAALVLDGKPLAVHDGGAEIASGDHVLVARARGFREQRIAIPAERAADYQLAIALVPEVAAGKRTMTQREMGIGFIEGGGSVLGIGFLVLVNAKSETDSDQKWAAGILLGAGGAAVVTGAIVWAIAPRERPQAARIAPVVGPGSAGVAVAGRF